MASALCLFHAGLLFSYFAFRYVVDIIFQPFGLLTIENDEGAYFFIQILCALFQAGQECICLVSRWRRPLAVLTCFVIVLPPTRGLILSACGSWKRALWFLMLKKTALTVEQRQLWLLLSSFITFTRLSSRRGHLEGNFSKPDSFGKSYRVTLVMVPLLIRLGVFYLFVNRIFLPLLPNSLHVGYSFFSTRFMPYSYLENTGFTAEIPSCYDGDTCHSHNLQFDGKSLPDLFGNLNIRILGIDAPELRSAKCDLERCLAERAKCSLEQIVDAGSGRRISLVDCRHDKYGGRLTCDISILETKEKNEGRRSVADEMLRTGLAIPYFGKRKAFSWCDSNIDHPHPNLIRPHLLACDWSYDHDEEDEEEQVDW